VDPRYLWIAFVILILLNVCSAFFQPAMQVVIVESVKREQRLAANSLLQGTSSFLIIVGQGLAAVLVTLFSYRLNFLIDAGCYFFSLLLLIRLPKLVVQNRQKMGTLGKRLRGGFGYIFKHGEIRRVLWLQMAERAAGAYYILLMYYLLQERKESLAVFGLMDIPLGIGGVLAGIIVGRWAGRLGREAVDKVLGGALVIVGVAILGLFQLKPFSLMVLSSLLLALASFSTVIITVTRMQQLASPDYLARLFSAREMLTMGTYSASCLVVGYTSEQFGSAAVAWMLALWAVGSGITWLTAAKHKKTKVSSAA
jgi:predicted MFS family arabinose efflux permease